jgi:hypothetical protein
MLDKFFLNKLFSGRKRLKTGTRLGKKHGLCHINLLN